MTPLVEVGVFILAIAVSLVLARTSKVLAIPALLLGGMAVGPKSLHIFSNEDFLLSASEIGLGLLLFYTSLFANPKALRDGGRIALPLACYDLVLNFSAAYWVGALFDWPLQSRLLLAGVMATSSTGAILKILSDEGRLLAREGNVLVALLWIEDLTFIGFYLFLSGHERLASFGFDGVAVLSLAGFVFFLALVYVAREWLWRVERPEILIPGITAIGILGTWLGTVGGLPSVASAFATGFVLSGSRGAHFIQAECPWLRDVAAAIFFLSFGALIDPGVTWSVLPMAVAALVGILITEALFVPQVARLLGLSGAEAHIVGLSLTARGGKSAAFAQLGATTTQETRIASQIQGISGILTLLLTPLAPLLVRFVLWANPKERGVVPSRRSRDVLSQITRRVLAPGEFAQRNLVPWLHRVELVEWFLLPFFLGVLGSLLAPPLRWGPLLLGLLVLPFAYLAAHRYFQQVPGTPGKVHGSRRKPLPRLESYLPLLLLGPFLLVLVLPMVAEVAVLAFPVLAAGLLLLLLLLPHALHPVPSAPPFARLPFARVPTRKPLRDAS